jgi:rhomboid protease GluP
LQVVDGGADLPADRRTGLPPETPYVTYALLALLAVVFAAMYAVGHGDINSVASRFGSKENDLIRAGEIWRFVTPIFLHGSVLHLVMNGVFLYWFGTQIEMLYGARKYLILFIVSGIVGNLFSFALSPESSLGASGALFGLVGAGLVFPLRFSTLVPPRARAEILRQLSTVVIVNLAIGFMPGSHVDNMAHLGGLAGGGFTALFLVPNALMTRPPSRLSNLAVTVVLGLLLLVVGAAGIAQYRVAQSTQPSLETFRPAESDPWWSIGIPQDWQQSGEGGIWVGPGKTFLQIEDSAPDSQVTAQKAQEAIQSGAQHSTLNVDGKPAEHILYETPDRSQIVDIYLVQAYGHVIALHLTAPARIYASLQPDFERVVSSLRIFHAPREEPDNAQSPPPVAGP